MAQAQSVGSTMQTPNVNPPSQQIVPFRKATTERTTMLVGDTVAFGAGLVKVERQLEGSGYIYGFSVMEMTGLPSGTVYPAMRRMERDELISSSWEQQSIADAEQKLNPSISNRHSTSSKHSLGFHGSNKFNALAFSENHPFNGFGDGGELR